MVTENERFVLQDAIKKMVDDEHKTSKAEMKGRLEEAAETIGADRIGVQIGRYKMRVTLAEGRKTIDADERGWDFLDFMEEHGMTVKAVDPDWKEHVEIVGESVVWKETGEVVPGAYVKHGASYPLVSGCKRNDLPNLLREAIRTGLVDGGVRDLIGGGDADN